MDIFARAEAILAAVPGLESFPEELADVAGQCAFWRATAEEAYSWDLDKRAFAGRCVDESEDLCSHLNRQMLMLGTEFRMGETLHPDKDGALSWHVVAGFRHCGERWIADVTADQFGIDLPRLVFGPLASLPRYTAVPRHCRSPEAYDTWFEPSRQHRRAA